MVKPAEREIAGKTKKGLIGEMGSYRGNLERNFTARRRPKDQAGLPPARAVGPLLAGGEVALLGANLVTAIVAIEIDSAECAVVLEIGGRIR